MIRMTNWCEPANQPTDDLPNYRRNAGVDRSISDIGCRPKLLFIHHPVNQFVPIALLHVSRVVVGGRTSAAAQARIPIGVIRSPPSVCRRPSVRMPAFWYDDDLREPDQ
jgi:hypothetical protein